MRIFLRVLLVIFIAGTAGFLVFYMAVMKPAFDEQKRVRSLTVETVDLEKIKDGTYSGEFTYSGTRTAVEITVKNHRITELKVPEHGTTEYAGKAVAGITEKILQTNSNNVDAVSGATTTSKALLKAVENALKSVQ